MPELTLPEVVELRDEAIALWQEIARSLRKDSDGGKKITKAEGRRILAKVTALGAELARELVD